MKQTHQTELDGEGSCPQYDAIRLERWGWCSLALNIVLTVLHGVIAISSGSLAVTAELIHNVVDLVSSAAILIGLRLATRKSEAFPYGLYKVENLLAAGVALLIFVSAYEIVHKALLSPSTPIRTGVWMIGLLLVTIALPLIFSHFELRAAVAGNSPALIADAKEFRIHMYTTVLALMALLIQGGWFPFDRVAALLITMAVIKTGWELLRDAMRVLLDASLDPGTLNRIRRLIIDVPAVSELRWLIGRNAGRFRFVEAGVTLRVVELKKAEAVLRRIESDIRKAVPFIERVLLHVEVSNITHLRYAVPLADREGTISWHFGEAPYFAIVTVNLADHAVEEERVISNPHQALEQAKGIRVAEWLARQKIDVVLLKEDIHHKGPEYVFRDAGISFRMTEKSTLAATLLDDCWNAP